LLLQQEGLVDEDIRPLPPAVVDEAMARSTGTAQTGDMHGAVLERGDKEQQAAPILAQRFLSIRNLVTSMYRE
jgi:hypothetical protein